MGKKMMTVLAVGMVTTLSVFGVTGCGQTEQSSTETTQGTQETQEATYELTPEDDLKDMELGDTAVFEPYEVTLESVDVDDEALTAKVTIKAHDQAQSLKAKYLKGGYIAKTSFKDDKIEVEAGESVTGTIIYSDNEIDSLEWNNWGYEAVWNFDNEVKEKAEAAKKTSKGLEANSAWLAVEAYGEEEYPYGFDLNWWTEKLAEENQGDTWYLKATANIKNASGVEAKYDCEAEVGGTDDNPKVTYFVVY